MTAKLAWKTRLKMKRRFHILTALLKEQKNFQKKAHLQGQGKAIANLRSRTPSSVLKRLNSQLVLLDKSSSQPVPSEHIIPGGLKLGQIIILQGFMPPYLSEYEVINLKPKIGGENNIHFHMSIRFNQNCIVRNTLASGSWGNEERAGGLPIQKGQQFQMIIAAHAHFFKISINGSHFADYNHRANFQDINVIGFGGDFQIQSVSFATDPTMGGTVFPAAYFPIYNPPVPSEQMIPGGLKLGQTITLQGFMPPSLSEYEVINLKPQMGNDIYFHMSIRFNQNCIVRNTLLSGGWGNEERAGGLPLQKGQNFQMIIAVHQQCFKVSINGSHFADYNHRANFQGINVIGFGGDFQIQSVSFGTDPTMGGVQGYYPTGVAMPPPPYTPSSNFPIYNPPMPYSGPISGGLQPGRMITVQGIVNPSPSRFHVNLNLGGDIALHFNPRFNEKCIVRNTRRGGQWGSEERHGSMFPFAPGAMFDIKVLVEPHCYKVAVNNQHFCEYNHRLNMLNMIQGLEVDGDVRLTQIFIF